MIERYPSQSIGRIKLSVQPGCWSTLERHAPDVGPALERDAPGGGPVLEHGAPDAGLVLEHDTPDGDQALAARCSKH